MSNEVVDVTPPAASAPAPQVQTEERKPQFFEIANAKAIEAVKGLYNDVPELRGVCVLLDYGNGLNAGQFQRVLFVPKTQQIGPDEIIGMSQQALDLSALLFRTQTQLVGEMQQQIQMFAVRNQELEAKLNPPATEAPPAPPVAG